MKRLINQVNNLLKAFYLRVQSIYLRGDKVVCNICHWKGRRFVNGRCPNCKSIPRTRLISYAFSHFGVEGIESLLHIAPNRTEMLYFEKNYDPPRYDRLDIIKRPFINLQRDLSKDLDIDNQYNVAFAWHVFEHIPDDKSAIKNVYKALKENGRFILSVPMHPPGRDKTFEDKSIQRDDFEEVHGHPDHCRSCGLDYKDRFVSAGFNVNELLMKEIDQNTRSRFGLSTKHVVWEFIK